MNGLLKIDSILHYVSDLETSTRFYQDVFHLQKAWEDKERGMVGFLFPKNNSEIVIHTDKTMPDPTYSFSVENVKEFCNEYKSLGFTVLVEPFEVRTGYFAILADLDGNKLAIIDLTKFNNKPRYDI